MPQVSKHVVWKLRVQEVPSTFWFGAGTEPRSWIMKQIDLCWPSLFATSKLGFGNRMAVPAASFSCLRVDIPYNPFNTKHRMQGIESPPTLFPEKLASSCSQTF